MALLPPNSNSERPRRSATVLPTILPIRVLPVALTKGRANPAASAFLAYLRGEKVNLMQWEEAALEEIKRELAEKKARDAAKKAETDAEAAREKAAAAAAKTGTASVAKNDSDPNNDPLTFTKLTNPTNGTVVFNPNAAQTFTLVTSADFHVNLGGRVTPAAAQATGNYTGTVTLTVTFF